MKIKHITFLLLFAALLVSFAGCKDKYSPTDNIKCGGVEKLTCPSGYTCDYPENTCNDERVEGLCFKTPEACTEQYEPVCGCDGNTYPNDCKRLMNGTPLAYTGECSK